MEAVSFYFFGAMALLAACSVAFTRHPIYAVLSLLVAMFALAALFVMLGAFFVAALQVLLYAGAVLVLFLFVIMLLNLAPEAVAASRIIVLRVAGTIAALALLSILITLALSAGGFAYFPPTPPDGRVASVGELLFTRYLLPFELTSFIILAAIIGAVTLAKQRPDEDR